MLPANTTHLLQSCDRSVNIIFQKMVRSTRDELLMISHMKWANYSFNIKVAVAGYRALTPEVARKPFYESGLWPRDFRILDRMAACQASGRLKGRLRSSSNMRSSLSVRNSHIGEIGNESRTLYDKIRQLSDGHGLACNSLAEIQVLFSDEVKENTFLDRQVSLPKPAKTSQRECTVNVPMAGVQRLQASSGKGTSKKTLEIVFNSESGI